MARVFRGRNSRHVYWLSHYMQDIIGRRRALSAPSRDQHWRYAGQRDLLGVLHNAFIAIAGEEAERLYASFGLEPRQPLYTPAFVQFAFSTPERLRLRGDQTKYIHVQALRGLMPKSIIERKDKAEFSVMFRQYIDQMKDVFTESLPRKRAGWVTQDGINELFQAYEKNRSSGWPLWILWSLLGCDIFLAVAMRHADALTVTDSTS